MEKVSILSAQKRRDWKKDIATTAAQVDRLTHSIMNQLTLIYLSCAKLRRGLGAKPCANEDSDIQAIESAVAKVTGQVDALRFRLEKTARPKTPLKKPQKQLRPGSKLSFFPPRETPNA